MSNDVLFDIFCALVKWIRKTIPTFCPCYQEAMENSLKCANHKNFEQFRNQFPAGYLG
jgi:hypothetical protein